MSAIAGIVSLSGKPIVAALIDRLTLSMTARGPDRRQTWQTERVALGHCLLRTTPEALHEEQPMASVDGHLRIVFDGRLDNRSELFRELRTRNVAIRDETDPALVLAAYSLWGEKVPERLLGDFAFAIWDSRENKVFCARDHIGNRPFYYVQTPDYFAIASDDTSLLDVPDVSAAPNDLMFTAAFISGIWSSMTENNHLRDVHVLMPGRAVSLHLQSGRAVWRTYWTPSIDKVAHYSGVAEASEAFREVFGQAVRARLRSNSPPAALFSGGMDSASIAATLAAFQRKGETGPIHGYSAIHDQPQTCVESRKILALAARCADVHHVQSVPSYAGPVDIDSFGAFMYGAPHPVDVSISIVALMCMMAQQNGHRVLLHGASGDSCSELGSTYIEHYVGRLALPELWRECQQASTHHSYERGKPAVRLLLGAIARHLLSKQQRLFIQRSRRLVQRDPVAASVISDHLAQELGIRKYLADMAATVPDDDPFALPAQRMRTMFPLGVLNGLEGYERVSGRASVEMRDPYADQRVIQFFLTLPPEYLVRCGWTKFLVRQAFCKELPDEVVWSSDKTHVGLWSYESLMQPSLDYMRAAGAPALAVFGRYFSPRHAAEAKELISGTLAPADIGMSRRRDFAGESFPFALWMASLKRYSSAN